MVGKHCNTDDLTIYIYNSKQGYCDYFQILNRWRVNDNIGVTDWTYRVKKKNLLLYLHDVASGSGVNLHLIISLFSSP